MKESWEYCIETVSLWWSLFRETQYSRPKTERNILDLLSLITIIPSLYSMQRLVFVCPWYVISLHIPILFLHPLLVLSRQVHSLRDILLSLKEWPLFQLRRMLRIQIRHLKFQLRNLNYEPVLYENWLLLILTLFLLPDVVLEVDKVSSLLSCSRARSSLSTF